MGACELIVSPPNGLTGCIKVFCVKNRVSRGQAECRPVKCCVSPFFCVGKQMFVCKRCTGRGRPAADACTGAKVQNCTDGTCSGRASCHRWLPSWMTPPPQPHTHSAPFCLTTAESDPFYLFIYLLNYLVIPPLVWPLNDPPGGEEGWSVLLQGQMTVHFSYWENKSKCSNTMGPYGFY